MRAGFFRWVLLLGMCLFLPTGQSSAAPSFPALTGRVVDGAHVLSQTTVQSLTAQLESHEQSTGEQIVVVTLSSLGEDDIADYGYQLGRAWGIGQKGKDNGALLIVAPNEHKTRIEVGYGLEDRLTDVQSSAIINGVMLPAFRTGDYDRGVSQGTQAVLSVLGGNDARPVTSASAPQGSGGLPIIILVLVFYLIFFRRRRSGLLAPMVFGSMLGRPGGGGSGGFNGGGGSFGGGGASGSW